MVMARLHIICGNCGCNDDFDYRIEPHGNDFGDGTFSTEVYITCNNCGTIHTLMDTVEEKPNRRNKHDSLYNRTNAKEDQ